MWPRRVGVVGLGRCGLADRAFGLVVLVLVVVSVSGPSRVRRRMGGASESEAAREGF